MLFKDHSQRRLVSIAEHILRMQDLIFKRSFIKAAAIELIEVEFNHKTKNSYGYEQLITLENNVYEKLK